MKFKTIVIAGFALMLSLAAFAADVTGKWTADVPGRNGQTRTQTITLKADGDKLTGTVSGPQGAETPITDGKITGDNISFTVKREFNGNEMKINYTGTVSGNEIKMKTQREGADRTQEFTAKRAS
jgi:opacity protein-like surface antigen